MKKIALSILAVLLFIEPSFSQDLGSDYQVFPVSTFENSGKTIHVLGAWSPSREDDYVLCIKDKSMDQYIIIRSSEEYFRWETTMSTMKYKLIEYDDIAKKNNVTSEIEKNLTDEFRFTALYFESKWYKYQIAYKSTYGEWDYNLATLYNYKDGQSYMGIYLSRPYKGWSHLLWTFRSAEEFDSMMDAISWSNFRKKVKELQEQNKERQNAAAAAAAKQKSESALFD